MARDKLESAPNVRCIGRRTFVAATGAALLGCENGVLSAETVQDAGVGSDGRAPSLGGRRSPDGSNFDAHAADGAAGDPDLGIGLPEFEYQQIADAVPAGAIWWDPTHGSDSNDGSSKQLAMKSFAAVEALASPTRRIIIAGGAVGSTTYHVLPKVVPTKSGSGPDRRIEIFAEPQRKVVLCMEGDFLGALDGSWHWTTVDAEKKIYESPALGIADGATSVTAGSPAQGRNWIAGILEIPNGSNRRPHMMFIPWVDPSNFENTGAGQVTDGGYAGPSVCAMGNGRVRLRLEPPARAVAGDEWPTDGLMGGLIAAGGTWHEPSGTANDYRLHLVRWDGDFGGGYAKLLFDFAQNNVDWWHLKGLNVDLVNSFGRMKGNTGIMIENCTIFPMWCHVFREGPVDRIQFRGCQIFAGDHRHLPWRTHKTRGYWNQHFRSTLLFDRGNTAGSGLYEYERCVTFGWFDLGLPRPDGGEHKFRYCAILNTVDDGAYQGASGGTLDLEMDHCFIFGGPPFGGGAGAPDAGAKEWLVHHCVIDHRLPMLWNPYGLAGQWGNVEGISPNLMITHSHDGFRPFKHYHNTFVCAANCGKQVGRGVMISTSDSGDNVPPGMAHEVYNNLITVIASRRYPSARSNKDPLVNRISCSRAKAGIHRYDYNLYYREVPGKPTHPAFFEIQDSKGVNLGNYESLVAFRASAHGATSRSMYSDGTVGHEEHGVEENPQFVDLSARDYRPRSGGATGGARDLTATGWPGTEAFQNWKGAVDPAGRGNEVGPLAP